ncbi:Uncharacterised protein [Mycobacteroides abscessus subsp. abscessus]|nr:Uncharacterised protein [Mycobacteroides abscessus subsp. abscessus]SID09210.1 Uncharacterised protein [Mycobacteroides abscessus subsp. abscessus]
MLALLLCVMQSVAGGLFGNGGPGAAVVGVGRVLPVGGAVGGGEFAVGVKPVLVGVGDGAMVGFLAAVFAKELPVAVFERGQVRCAPMGRVGLGCFKLGELICEVLLPGP